LRRRLVATWAEFQHSVVYYATDQCRKKLEASINAKDGHSEHLRDIACLTFQLPQITIGSFQSRQRQPATGLFSELLTFERTQQTFSQTKKFCNSQVNMVTFSGGLQFVFF